MNHKTSRRVAMKQIAVAGSSFAGIPATIVTGQEIDNVGELAKSFRLADERSVFDVASNAIRDGADYKTLLSAVFVAGVHEIRPRPVGGKLHSVMMIDRHFN